MIERIEAAGEAAAARACTRLAARIREEVPGAAVAEGADGVTVRGRGIIGEPRLRWIAGLLR